MYTQQFRSVSNRSLLNSFLNHVNYNKIYLLPYNSNAQILAAQIGNGRRIKGKDLMKRNVEHEARRLQLNSRYLINLATDHIWNLRSTSSQRNRFISLANNANDINQNRVSRIRLTDNVDTLDRIAQMQTINSSLITSSFEQNFFNGAKFHDNDSLESLILPAGCLGSSLFP